MTQQSIQWTPSRRLRVIAAVCAAAMMLLLCELLAAQALLKPVSRDEHMYCTAAVLMADGQLPYRDFSYPAQLPYHPLLLAAVYKTLGTSHYLLAGRLVSIACDILTVLAIAGIYLHAFGGRCLQGLLLGLAGIIFYAFNPVVTYSIGYAWNHDAVVLCVVLSLWLFVTTDFLGRRWIWRVAAMGALLTLASCMRVTTVLVELLFFVAVFVFAGKSPRQRLWAILPFSLAGLVVAAWPIWVCLQAPRAFWLNLVRIPALYGRWLHGIGMAYGKLSVTTFCLSSPQYLVLLAVCGYLLWTAWRRRSQWEAGAKRHLAMTVLVVVVFVVIAFVPPTMWNQYWAAPVPFLAIAMAYPLAHLQRCAEATKKARPFRIAAWAVFIGATITVLANLDEFRRLGEAAEPQKWAGLVLHEAAVDIVSGGDASEPILTLGPLYALEGGGSIYRELASGSIVYRIADSLSSTQREATHTVGPETLRSIIDREPPAAIVLGVEPPALSSLEEPLEAAAGVDWQTRTYEPDIRVLRRP